MVLTARPSTAVPTLVVPDEQAWALSGSDPAAEGLRPVFALGEVGRLLLPQAVPPPLDDALESCLTVLPADVEVETRVLPGLAGRPVTSILAYERAGSADAHGGGHAAAHHEHDVPAGHRSHGDDDERRGRALPAGHGAPDAADAVPGHGGDGDHHATHGDHHATHGDHHATHGDHHATHGDHGDNHGTHGDHGDMHGDHHAMHGDHGDMMAIVGEPSADGLVMEPIHLRYGPLGTPLPGGLAVDVTLDGDVVAEATVQALLRADPFAGEAPSPPDLLAPLSWTLVMEASTGAQISGSPWRRLAALEVERAVSHLAWLRAFGRLLGWPRLVDRCTRVLGHLPVLAHRLAAREQPRAQGERGALEGAVGVADSVTTLVAQSRLLRIRTRGLAPVSRGHARHAGLRGPVARATGARDDARLGDLLYERLGFEPVLHTGGDAYARTLVRAEEAPKSLRLAAAALRADADGAHAPAPFPAPGEELEGPRGPLRAERGVAGLRPVAPGSDEARGAAGEAMVGAEWSAALVALASFDVSPWRIEA